MNSFKIKQQWRMFLPPLLFFFCASPASTQETASIAELRATQHPLSNVGLAIGERIPEFRAPDQNGTMRDFDSIRGPKGAVFTFYRSADWCIYCQTQLVETEASRATLRKNGLGLAGISYDSTEQLKKFADAKDVHFPLLSDPDSKIINDFQVLDATVLPGTPGYGVPYHGSYIVDEKGIVVAKLFDAEATLSHSTGIVVSKLFGSPQNTHEKIVKFELLTLSYYASANTVSPGDEIELIIDVALSEKNHVYAPGGPYLPVDWQIVPQPGVTVHPVAFPPAQTLRLNTSTTDTAQGYAGNFRLSRRITIAPEGVATLDSQGNVALKGTFSFQACDDRICYQPATITLEWKLGRTNK